MEQRPNPTSLLLLLPPHPSTLPLPLWNLCPHLPLFLISSLLLYKPLTFTCLFGIQKPVILWLLSDISNPFHFYFIPLPQFCSPIIHQLFANYFPIIFQLFANYFPIIFQLFANYFPIIRQLFANYFPIIFQLFRQLFANYFPI